MSKLEKFVAALLSTQTDKNIDFAALCGLLLKLGFSQRVKGSHHIFARTGVEEIINLQSNSEGRAKPYQVKQVRDLLQKYNLTLDPTPQLRVTTEKLAEDIVSLKRKPKQ
ncbi:hypothetical protein SAMN02745146_2593 [Hymenobacter daecheongensis DSM 21074]|uniref:HicA toxin of toxin-antitoxin n=1 Tax=Hymenobacter daecheongensis DSM 21074 TaxID=1121955 RepID=A0A1M6HQ94_9BACT|nr:type II toxin-antitoxin system HicA family toxin [Hymenobacter daecheongensis]SHJ24390.1 hypothetical protein SAMN02745146_2593 [Hymenobacter daecheongensis DSM 21074]